MPGIKSLFQKYRFYQQQRKNKDKYKENKVTITSIFLQNQKSINKEHNIETSNFSLKTIDEYQKLFENQILEIEKLKKLAWNGIPQSFRSRSWKVLLKYTSANKDNHQHFLNVKRRDYIHMVKSYIEDPNIQFDTMQKKTLKLIHDDVVRTMPDSTLFRLGKVQQMLQRILYIWHVRHPSSGYVQGLNDIATPFLITFLSDYIKIDFQKVQAAEDINNIDQKILTNIEADCYWCFTKVLNSVLDNYTTTWPGIQRSFQSIKQIIMRVDPDLFLHFQNKGIDLFHIYFKWVTCLLLRQFSTKIGLRLFDTYITLQSQQGAFFKFIQYIFVAIFLKFSKKLKKLNFQQLMSFQHKMPTKNWNEQQISTIIAQAFVYQNFFNSQ